MMTASFTTVRRFPDDGEWDFRVRADGKSASMYCGTSEVRFEGVCRLQILPLVHGPRGRHYADGAPKNALSEVQGHPDDERLWGSRIGATEVQKYVLACPLGVFIVQCMAVELFATAGTTDSPRISVP